MGSGDAGGCAARAGEDVRAEDEAVVLRPGCRLRRGTGGVGHGWRARGLAVGRGGCRRGCGCGRSRGRGGWDPAPGPVPPTRPPGVAGGAGERDRDGRRGRGWRSAGRRAPAGCRKGRGGVRGSDSPTGALGRVRRPGRRCGGLPVQGGRLCGPGEAQAGGGQESAGGPGEPGVPGTRGAREPGGRGEAGTPGGPGAAAGPTGRRDTVTDPAGAAARFPGR